MSRYQPYPSYKDSGVEWLGDVPEHWGIGLLSSLFSDNKEKNAGLKNSNLLSLSYGNIIQKDIDTITGLLPESFDSYQIVHPGYIVLRLTDLQNDKKSLRTGFVRETGIITSAYVGLAKKSQSIGNEKYFYLYLHTFDAYKGFYGMGAGVRQGLNFDELKKLKFTLPPFEEQNRIVEFIEKETSKIDTLIAKQQRMIELLGEKRSALISHAVTKGINPNVAMKDSGIEWLGEVPEGWRVLKFNYCTQIGNGQVNPMIEPFNEYTLIAPNHIEKETGKILFLESATDQGADSGKYVCHKGDVIYSKIRPALAKVCISPYEQVLCSADMYPIHATNGLSNFFLFWFLLSKEFTSYAILQSDRVAMPKLNRDTLGESYVPFPDYVEQQQIIHYLDTQTTKIDTLIAKARQAIELMKERRTALISAAVTGKIDVRGI